MPDLFTDQVIEFCAPMQHDSKRIVRDWNREIEAEDRRLASRQDGWGKIVVWTVLELIWLVAIITVLGLVSRLY